jgi:hypothetical protein
MSLGFNFDLINRYKEACVCSRDNLQHFHGVRFNLVMKYISKYLYRLVMEGGSIYKEGFEKWLGWTRPFHLASLFEERDMYYSVRLPKRAWLLATNQTDKLAHSDKDPIEDLTLKHISGAFYSLFVGCFLCILIFIQEIVYKNKNNLVAKKAKALKKLRMKNIFTKK